MDIAIIGAGPVGCYAGYLLAKKGHSVTIYENHPKVGLPIQCTGLLTADFEQFKIPLNDFLTNTFSEIRIISPNHSLKIKQKEYLVSRNKFDNFLADMAHKEGAEILCNNTFIRKEGKDLIIKETKRGIERRVHPKIVIAADGPLSPTAKAYGFYHKNRRNYYGTQAIVEGKFDENCYQAYFGKETCPGFFAWIVPESEKTARVGLAMRKEPQQFFQRFIQKNGFKIREIQAGVIPIYNPRQRLYKENCYLLGDAAGFVKATTLGGIIPGMRQAEILASCIKENRINVKRYAKEIKPLEKRLRLHLRLRKILNRFSDEDWDKMIRYLNQPKVKTVLEKHTRENPFPLIMKALLREPRFLMFMKYLV